MATNLSAHSVIRNGASPSAVIIKSQNELEKLFDSLIHIGKLKHDKRHEELTALENSVITLGAYISALQIPWPKPTDLLGDALVRTLEYGEKLWPLQHYFKVNPCMPTKKLDQIEDELERELYPERTALTEDTERKRIETERHEHATELQRYHSNLSSQLSLIAEYPEKQLREMKSCGFEIIREMIDPCSTDCNRAEPNPPKLPKVQPSFTNPIVTGDSVDDFSPFNSSKIFLLENDDDSPIVVIPIVANLKSTLKALEVHLRGLFAEYKSIETNIEQSNSHLKLYWEDKRDWILKEHTDRLLQIRGFDSLRTYANSQFKSPVTIQGLREIYSTLTDKLGVTLTVVENMDLEQAVANLTTPPALAVETPTAKPDDRLAGLLEVIRTSNLSPIETMIVESIYNNGGAKSIAELLLDCDNADVISAFKRAKKKLKKLGWNLHQKHNQIVVRKIQVRVQK